MRFPFEKDVSKLYSVKNGLKGIKSDSSLGEGKARKYIKYIDLKATTWYQRHVVTGRCLRRRAKKLTFFWNIMDITLYSSQNSEGEAEWWVGR